VDWLVSTGQRQEVQPGEILIYEGRSCEQLYIILAGQLEVSVQAMAQHTIAQLASGEVVGEMSFVDGLPPSATVTALEKPWKTRIQSFPPRNSPVHRIRPNPPPSCAVSGKI